MYKRQVHNADVEGAASALKDFGFGDGFFEGFRGTVHFGAAGLESFGDTGEDALEARAAHGVFGRKIGAPEKRFTVGSCLLYTSRCV